MKSVLEFIAAMFALIFGAAWIILCACLSLAVPVGIILLVLHFCFGVQFNWF